MVNTFVGKMSKGLEDKFVTRWLELALSENYESEDLDFPQIPMDPRAVHVLSASEEDLGYKMRTHYQEGKKP